MFDNFCEQIYITKKELYMTEKEKMLAGEYYKSMEDTVLVEERKKVKDLCYQYNSLSPYEEEKKTNLIKQIFGKTGENIIVEPSFYCDYGYNIEVGENFYMNHNCVILDCNKLVFGDNVFVGPNCSFYTPLHPMDAETRNTGVEKALPITVGNNVWFGGSVTVLPGVTIGDNAVIGAGSVVAKDIPANTLAVGNPCKVVRNIYS